MINVIYLTFERNFVLNLSKFNTILPLLFGYSSSIVFCGHVLLHQCYIQHFDAEDQFSFLIVYLLLLFLVYPNFVVL